MSQITAVFLILFTYRFASSKRKGPRPGLGMIKLALVPRGWHRNGANGSRSGRADEDLREKREREGGIVGFVLGRAVGRSVDDYMLGCLFALSCSCPF